MRERQTLDYRDKQILAPMVRVGTLPMRMLSLEYGADIVYSEELIDHRLAECTREENDAIGTVDFVDRAGRVMYRTCDAERGRVVQIGTASAAGALAAAQVVCKDVDAIDVNMGCPVKFSTAGGMGSALLHKPEVVRDILTTLRRNLPNQITCKIRLLETPAATLDFARMVEQCGVAALGVHGRYIPQRPREPAHWDLIAPIAQALSIPVIANGDVFARKDIERVKKATGVASVMFARGAMWNPSVFSPDGMLPLDTVMRDYCKLAIRYDNSWRNSKYVVMKMLEGKLNSPLGQQLTHTKSAEDLYEIFDLMDALRATRRIVDRSKRQRVE